MNTIFMLKEKGADKIVYYYSSDVANFGGRENTPVDGELKYTPSTNKVEILKTATGDEDGFHAKWFSGHLRHVILEEGCPERRFVAVG